MSTKTDPAVDFAVRPNKLEGLHGKDSYTASLPVLFEIARAHHQGHSLHSRHRFATQAMSAIEIWTVYYNTRDFPALYAARLWYDNQATSAVFSAHSLKMMRIMLPSHLTRMTRHEDDDPCIVEVWL
jgi:hypothetical protein